MILDMIKKIEALESYDSQTIMDTFSFEERRLLVTEIQHITSSRTFKKIHKFVEKLIDEKVVIFTPEELARIEIKESYFFGLEELLYVQFDDEKLLEMILSGDQVHMHLYRYLKHDESIYKLVEAYVNEDLDDIYREIVANALCCAKSDEFKVKCIQLLSKLPKKKRLDGYEKAQIVETLSTDEAKIEALHYVPNDCKQYVIRTMESDDTKARYITLFSRNKGDIIASLKDDELKEYYFKKYYRVIDGENKAYIVTSFENIELTRKYLPLINGNRAVYVFVWRCNDEDLSFEATQKLTTDIYLVMALEHFKKPDHQLAIMKRIRDINAVLRKEDRIYQLGDLSIEALGELIPKLSDVNKERIIKRKEYPKNVAILHYIRDFNKVLECLGHMDDDMFGPYSPMIDKTIDYIAKNTNINPERLRTLVKCTGGSLLKFINNKNIIDALNLSDEDFEKYLMLIKPEHLNMDMDSVNNILNIILNRKFKLEQKEDDRIFSSFQLAIETGDKKSIRELFEKLSTLVDIKTKITDLDSFIERLVSRDANALDDLHDLTSEYIRIAKDNFVRDHMAETREQIVNISIDRGEYIKTLLASSDPKDIIRILEDIKENVNESNLRELIDDKELLTKLIEYKKDPQKYGAPPKEMKRSLKDLNILLNYIYKYNSSALNGYEYLKDAFTTVETAPIQYTESVVYILSEMNVQELKDTVFSNEELFQELLKFIDKYKVFGWSEPVKVLATNNGFVLFDSVIAALVSNYETIIRVLNEKVERGDIPKVTISHIIDLAACYDSSSVVYKYIFGLENFMLIKNDPGPNKATSMSPDEKVARALELLGPLRARDSITTPPIDKDYELYGDKKLHIRLGHVNSTNNLSYGERTGACMRIDGAGETLFEFCLLNKNGFHVEITDPETGKFVSRVSGFRNGNTVFLNQLRECTHPGYNNSDLVEVIKKVGRDIVELSKKSDFPIDNVVISSDFAMSKSGEKITDLGVSDIKKGYPKFWTDVSGRAIVLATSGEGEYVPVILRSKDLPEYEPLRERVRTYKDEQASIKINEMLALDEFLSGKPVEEIELTPDLEINTCYMGHDWYVSISSDGQITTFIMETCKNRELAEKEVKKTLDVIKEKGKKQIAMMAATSEISTSSSVHM